MAFTKIQANDYVGKDVASAPDTLTGTKAENKAIFDRAIKEVVAVAVNNLIDELSANGATDISASVTGITGATIQAVLTALKAYTDTHTAKTDNPHSVTALQVGATTASDVSALISTALAAYYTKAALNELLADKADVDELSNYYLKTAVDTLLDGKVDKVTGKGLSDVNYTAEEKGKLETIEIAAQENDFIYVNGTFIPPVNKAVDIAVPTKTSDITNDSTYQTFSQVTALITAAVDGAVEASY